MSWWNRKKRKEDSDRYKTLKGNLGESINDYDPEAYKLRGYRERDLIKRDSKTRPQLVNEENQAIEFSKEDKNGRSVARKSVNKRWWEKL